MGIAPPKASIVHPDDKPLGEASPKGAWR